MMPQREIVLTSISMKTEIMNAQAALSPTHFPNCFLSIASRSVPKFMKRIKVPDYKEKSVFGVPLIVHVQRCGFPLPLCLQQALCHLRTHCLDQVRKQFSPQCKFWLFTFPIWDSLHKALCLVCFFFHLSPLAFLSQVGLFRKSGVKSRIQALRQQCELSPDCVSYEDQSAYDVADMVKQFFRDLPEPLLTSKLGETFLHIYQCKSPRSCEPCDTLSPRAQNTEAVATWLTSSASVWASALPKALCPRRSCRWRGWYSQPINWC